MDICAYKDKRLGSTVANGKPALLTESWIFDSIIDPKSSFFSVYNLLRHTICTVFDEQSIFSTLNAITKNNIQPSKQSKRSIDKTEGRNRCCVFCQKNYDVAFSSLAIGWNWHVFECWLRTDSVRRKSFPVSGIQSYNRKSWKLGNGQGNPNFILEKGRLDWSFVNF